MKDENAPRSKSRVLLVEDDEVTRDLVVRWLVREHYEVDGFGDAEGALERLREASYAAVVTDHNLPGMTGLELARAATSEKLVGAAQIAIVSAFPPVEEAAAIGVTTLQKPVDIHRLLALIERLLAAEPSEQSPRSTEGPQVRLLLYVSEGSLASARAHRAIWHVTNAPGAEHVHLEVRDVAAHAAEARADRVAFTPTLLRVAPLPMLRIIGDLRDAAVLADAVSVWPSPA